MKYNRIASLSIMIALCIVVSSLKISADQSIKVQDDFGKGIKSNVFVSLGNEYEAKGITDDLWILLIKTPCLKGKQIKARPVNPLYYEGFADCLPNKDQLVVKVTKKAFAQNLNWNAKIFEATGNLGNAALTYSEIATRLHKINPGKASVARNKAYSTFAAAIKTPINVKVSGFDEKQGIVVLTNEFVNYLKEYQKKKNVPATGAIDFKTLKTQSDLSVGAVLTNKMDINSSGNL